MVTAETWPFCQCLSRPIVITFVQNYSGQNILGSITIIVCVTQIIKYSDWHSSCERNLTLFLLQMELHCVFLTNKNSSPEYCNYSTFFTNDELISTKTETKAVTFFGCKHIVLHILTTKESRDVCLDDLVFTASALLLRPMCCNDTFFNFRPSDIQQIVCQVVAYGRLKTIENLKNHL